MRTANLYVGQTSDCIQRAEGSASDADNNNAAGDKFSRQQKSPPKLSDLPADVLENIFLRLDEASRGSAASVCKHFSSLMPEVRLGALLPTRLELLNMGCQRPDAEKILAAFARRAPGAQLNLRRHYEKCAALQKAVRSQTAASFFVASRLYTGAAKNGVPHHFGWHERHNGCYEGEFRDGKADGWGALIWTRGDCYEGQFKNGKAHGQGVMTTAEGRYEGEFREGYGHGRGFLVLADGSHREMRWEYGWPVDNDGLEAFWGPARVARSLYLRLKTFLLT